MCINLNKYEKEIHTQTESYYLMSSRLFFYKIILMTLLIGISQIYKLKTQQTEGKTQIISVYKRILQILFTILYLQVGFLYHIKE